MSRVTVNNYQATPGVEKTSTEDSTSSDVVKTSIEDATQKIAKAKLGSNSESLEPTSTQTFTAAPNNTHCLVVEEEHDMSQYLTNCGYSCYRLTHRNADSGAANGLLTKIRNREFCVLMIHMPVKKKDIRENRSVSYTHLTLPTKRIV